MNTGRLFAIGQAVICIDDNFVWARKMFPGIIYPVFGQRYIIRRYFDIKPAAVLLREISNRDVIYMDGIRREAGFWDKRFVNAPLPEALQISTNLTLTREKEAVQ